VGTRLELHDSLNKLERESRRFLGGRKIRGIAISTFFAVGWTLVLNISSANAGIFSASNFDDCLIEGMQDVGSDQVANMVMGDCWRKFPEGSHGQQESSGLFQFGPTSWSDCILSYMPGVESERAAQGIAGACGRKFPSRNRLEASDALESAAKERVKNCVMRYGKTTTSEVAALAIQGACRQQ